MIHREGVLDSFDKKLIVKWENCIIFAEESSAMAGTSRKHDFCWR